MDLEAQNSTPTLVAQAPTVADYARAQVDLLQLISKTVQYKQRAFGEVENAAKKHSVPISDLLAWFQAATSL